MFRYIDLLCINFEIIRINNININYIHQREKISKILLRNVIFRCLKFFYVITYCYLSFNN